MQINFKDTFKRVPAFIEIRILYHFAILLLNAYFLIEFLSSKIGNRTFFQKLCYLTSLNQVSIVIYYLIVFFYNIRLYINSYPASTVKRCPKLLLVYLKTNLSVACLVVVSFWLMKIIAPEMLIPKKLEETVQIPWIVDVWLHLINFLFLLLELVWEQHRRFQFPMEKQFHVFLVIFFTYGVVLLGHDLYYEKQVYPFLRHLTVLTSALMSIVTVGLLVIFDFGFNLVIQELWTD